ncbi:MAG: HEAT repeat domain-containing protein [Candidatus Eisenbacteria bacterium]
MTVSARAAQADPKGHERRQPDAVVKAAGAWIAQFARALKTCRLYDGSNPTVVRFREELGAAGACMVEEHGAILFQFESDDVTCDGISLYPARSRDDNLAFVFHRDGVRGIALNPGIEPREVDALVDCVLAVSGQNLDDDDLVTLLWESNLRHVDIDYVPAQSDLGSGEAKASGEEGDGPLLPWPMAEVAENDPGSSGPGADDGAAGSGVAGATGRSEDWALSDLTVEVEATYVELDSLAPAEGARFRHEFQAEHAVPPTTAALAIANACLNAQASEEDAREFTRLLPRVLRVALTAGDWVDARDALRVLRAAPTQEWNEEIFQQELLQPVSISRAVEHLDAQAAPAIGQYLQFAEALGDIGIDWMTLLLSESQQRVVRQLLAEAVAGRCRENPERLAPWLADSRWYVVRNIVHILGWIGGPAIVGLLQVALRHPDGRVGTEVVAALQNVELRLARPILIRALDGADTRLFCQVLYQLSGARDPATARFVSGFLQRDTFAQRPAEERRAIYAAIASTGGDEVVAELEAELHKATWFDRQQEIHRHAVARCLARIHTPVSQAALEHGAKSSRAQVRQACELALRTLRPEGER